MLGMAVDANVLIYERLREERERGANLALALRNGYDRALPTIIDTHLTSIFTAIVLYAVGNDQLKGFGISLTVGLIISLFTSLYMTRLMFDLWQSKGWLKKLSMYQGLTNFLHRHYIDFMSVRNFFFTLTIVLTVIGLGVFLYRGPSGLNIDFVGGTAYGGRLVKPMKIENLRKAIDCKTRQTRFLAVERRRARTTKAISSRSPSKTARHRRFACRMKLPARQPSQGSGRQGTGEPVARRVGRADFRNRSGQQSPGGEEPVLHDPLDREGSRPRATGRRAAVARRSRQLIAAGTGQIRLHAQRQIRDPGV